MHLEVEICKDEEICRPHTRIKYGLDIPCMRKYYLVMEKIIGLLIWKKLPSPYELPPYYKKNDLVMVGHVK